MIITAEIEMNSQRYTESQVLFGLREAWQDFTGVDDPFDADTRIDTYMKADGSWDELDFADILRGIEQFFGFICSDNEWTDFFELIATWGTSNPIWIIPTLLIATASYILASAYKRFTNPLPTHIVTFRDLSLLIATQQS